MEEYGYIIEILDDKTAKLKMQKHSACSACGKCVNSSEKKDIIVEVDNAIGAQIGDRVKVNMESVNVLKAVFLVYLVPLISFLITTIVAYFALDSFGIRINIEEISFVIGILFMFLSFIILKKKDKTLRNSREYIPIITEII